MKTLFTFFICFSSFSFCQIISSDLDQSWSIFDIQDIYSFGNFPDYVGDINYAVNGYKISYLTSNEDGDLVLASGSIFVPVDVACSLPILSWQHGTVVADAGAPSENISSSMIGVIAASHGYLVLMSDYVGLGSGEGFHNYCHAETEASAVIDLIIQSDFFLNSIGIEANGQLFLMGYSQGGHATMATVKELELNFTETLSVTASAPMAGPYSMSEAQVDMLNTIYPNPGYFPYIIFAYQNVYDNLYNDVSELLKPGFSDLLSMYDGTYSMTEINDEIWSIGESLYGIPANEFTPLDMIQDAYYDAYQNNDNHPFRIALEENDLIDFIPQSPMRLIHCSGDNDVPYTNSVMAWNAFSPFVAEELVLLDGGYFSHSECAQFAIISAKLFFDELADFCIETNLIETLNSKQIINTVDLLGKPTSLQESNLVLRLYSDGSVDKLFLF